MASRHGNWAPDCKVYIGDLKPGTTERDIEEPFSKFGQLRNVWVAQRPPGKFLKNARMAKKAD